MPDISMCLNENCKLKHKCYRYCAIPSEHWQAYFTGNFIDGKCEYFWKIENSPLNNKIRRLLKR